MAISEKRYYDEFTATVYDQEYSISGEEILFYIDLARQTKEPILELGCGTGAILLPLAERGFSVVGVDSSKFMLSVLRKKIKEKKTVKRERITLFESKMEEFKTQQQFGLIIIANNTFLHLDNLAKVQLLKNLPRLLAPDGLIVIDIFNPRAKGILLNDLYYMRGYPVFYKDKMYLVNAYTRHRPKEQELIVMKEYIRVNEYGVSNEDSIRTSFKLHYLFKEQFENLVKTSGKLKINSIFGSYQKAIYTEKSDRMIFVLTQE